MRASNPTNNEQGEVGDGLHSGIAVLAKTIGILLVLGSIGLVVLPAAHADLSQPPAAESGAPGAAGTATVPIIPLESLPPRPEAEPQPPDPAIRQYEDKVKALERRGGAYDPGLPETLVALGLARLARQDYVGAEAALERALHTTRVNNGLYSVEQLPILERLVDINTATHDYLGVNQNYHYLFWLSKRIYGTDDPRLLAEIDRMGRWHLAAFAEDVDDMPMSHLFAADDLYRRAVDIIDGNYGSDDPRLVNALYGVVVTKYQIAAQVARIEQERNILDADADELDSRSVRVYRDAGYRERLMIDCFSDGKEAMDRIAAIHESNDLLGTESHALALVHLGDWNLLFNKWNSAREAYEDAYALLRDDGRPDDEIDAYFDRPRALPAIGLPEEQLAAFLASGGRKRPQAGTEPGTPSDGVDPDEMQAYTERDDEQAPEEEVPYVVMSLDVSSSGKPTNVSVVESSPDDDALKRKAKRSIRGRIFRPRIAHGEPVDTEDMQIKMVFED